MSDFNITKMEILMTSSAFDLSGVTISSFHIKMEEKIIEGIRGRVLDHAVLVPV